jgi:hypothetical protein
MLYISGLLSYAAELAIVFVRGVLFYALVMLRPANKLGFGLFDGVTGFSCYF